MAIWTCVQVAPRNIADGVRVGIDWVVIADKISKVLSVLDTLEEMMHSDESDSDAGLYQSSDDEDYVPDGSHFRWIILYNILEQHSN